MKRLGAPRRELPFGAQRMAAGRVPWRLGWAALGALAVGATARALSRSGRSPSTGAPPDGEEPDVLLDVRELASARM